MNILAIALLSIALSVAAQFALKAGMSNSVIKEAMLQSFSPRTPFVLFSNAYVLLGFCLYGLGAVFWLGVLAKWEVSKAYPLVGFGFAITVVIGWLVGEHVTMLRASGALLICAGVFLVSRS